MLIDCDTFLQTTIISVTTLFLVLKTVCLFLEFQDGRFEKLEGVIDTALDSISCHDIQYVLTSDNYDHLVDFVQRRVVLKCLITKQNIEKKFRNKLLYLYLKCDRTTLE